MLTQEQIEALTDKYLIKLFQQLEHDVIVDIARRVRKTGRLTETAEIMAREMRDLGYSPSEIRKEVMKTINADKALQKAIAENTKQYKAEVTELIKEARKEANVKVSEMTKEAYMMSYNSDLSMWEEAGVPLSESKQLAQIADAIAKTTQGRMRNMTKTMAFKTADGSTIGIMNAYRNIIDRSLVEVAVGAFDFNSVVTKTVIELANMGLRTVDYESGRAYQLDTAARMNIRSGLNQLAAQVTESNINNSSTELVYVSAHAGARPEHAVWQGEVYAWENKHHPKYKDFATTCDYGSVTGIMGVNCSHYFTPYWEGISIIPEFKEPDPVEVDGKVYDYYEATQKQRAMERSIRALKREKYAAEALGEDTKVLAKKIKQKEQDYKAFSVGANLRPKPDRISVSA